MGLLYSFSVLGFKHRLSFEVLKTLNYQMSTFCDAKP